MRLPASLCVLLCLCTAASATTVNLVTPSGVDTGWSATFDDTRTDVIVDSVTSTSMRIEIFKNIDSPPFNMILFTPRLPSALALIRISDESISNNTGLDWSSYQWQINGGGTIGFDSVTTVSNGFSIDPFTQMQWLDPIGAQYYQGLLVSGGGVADGDSYTPGLYGGSLDINTAVGLGSSPSSFSLLQAPVPEPNTILLLTTAVAAIGRYVSLRRKAARDRS